MTNPPDPSPAYSEEAIAQMNAEHDAKARLRRGVEWAGTSLKLDKSRPTRELDEQVWAELRKDKP